MNKQQVTVWILIVIAGVCLGFAITQLVKADVFGSDQKAKGGTAKNLRQVGEVKTRLEIYKIFCDPEGYRLYEDNSGDGQWVTDPSCKE